MKDQLYQTKKLEQSAWEKYPLFLLDFSDKINDDKITEDVNKGTGRPKGKYAFTSTAKWLIKRISVIKSLIRTKTTLKFFYVLWERINDYWKSNCQKNLVSLKKENNWTKNQKI